MALTYSQFQPTHSVGSFHAPDFQLPGVDGKTYSLASFKEARALLVIFMCNHCPYVIAVQDRINQLAIDYGAKGVAVLGICSNDPVKYPADNFEAMKAHARAQGYVFAYAQDITQEVAKAYDAVCTPDPYLFENLAPGKGSDFLLRYHGRIDDSWKDVTAVTRRDLSLAIEAVLAGKPVNPEQIPAMGCSIKWRA